MKTRRNRIFNGPDDSLVACARLACIDSAGTPAPGMHVELKAERKTQHNTNTQHYTTQTHNTTLCEYSIHTTWSRSAVASGGEWSAVASGGECNGWWRENVVTSWHILAPLSTISPLSTTFRPAAPQAAKLSAPAEVPGSPP